MTAPRHLWSGDWQLDSATAAEELAKRRAQTDEPADTEPELPPAPSGPSLATVWLRKARRTVTGVVGAFRGKGRQVRRALLVAALMLLSAGAAYGVTSVLVGSGDQGSAAASGARAWFGASMASSPFGGVVVASVVPGSPAQAAGLQPGDAITAIGNQPVSSVDGVTAALAGLHAGNRVEIQFNRGAASYTTLATLKARPPGSP
jgi:S1-C subfamily serine protease